MKEKDEMQLLETAIRIITEYETVTNAVNKMHNNVQFEDDVYEHFNEAKALFYELADSGFYEVELIETTKNPFRRITTNNEGEYLHVILRVVINYFLTMDMKEWKYKDKRIYVYDDQYRGITIIFSK